MSWGMVAVGVGTAVAGAVGSKQAADIQEDAQREATSAQMGGMSNELAFQKEEAEKAREFQQQQIERQDEFREFLRQTGEEGLLDIEQGRGRALAAGRRGDAAASEMYDPLLGTGALEQARGILRDPSGVLDSPAAQFERRQGEKQMEKLLSKTTGGGLTGGSLMAAQQFGQEFAGSQIDKALGRLMPFINLDVSARQNIAQIAAGGGYRDAELEMETAGRKTSTRLAGAGGSPAIFSPLKFPGIGQTMSRMGQVQGQGALQQSNIQSNLLQNLVGIGGQLGQAAAFGMAGGAPPAKTAAPTGGGGGWLDFNLGSIYSGGI